MANESKPNRKNNFKIPSWLIYVGIVLIFLLISVFLAVLVFKNGENYFIKFNTFLEKGEVQK